MSARKHRTENRSVYDIHEDSSTELTPQSRKKTIFRGALKNMNFSELNLLSYNTWKCDGQYPQRLALARDVLLHQQVDIYLLQEVFLDTEGHYNTLRELFPEQQSFQIIFHPARFKERLVNGQSVRGFSGLALVSCHPMVSHGCFSLPGHPQDPQRFCQWCVISLAGIRVAIFNTHLTHLAGQQTLRQQQIKQIADFANKLPYQIIVIGGDMNSAPFPSSLMGDFECCYQGLQPNTLNIDGAGCLDHLYLHASKDVNAAWLETQLLLDQEVDGVWPGDHKAVSGCVRID